MKTGMKLRHSKDEDDEDLERMYESDKGVFYDYLTGNWFLVD